jgi:TPR repeat protein
MKILIFMLFTVLSLNTAWAGQFEDAVSANLKGDFKTVLQISQAPALKGEAWAQFVMGSLYDNGQGVIQDYVEAVKWYALAAQQGHASAQYNLGYMYLRGQGVTQDLFQGLKWYRLAAQQGHASGQYNLGVLYQTGLGVAQDYVKAHSWFNLAAALGNTNAVNFRDIAASLMTQQQISQAQNLARECLARQFKDCD